MTSDDVIDPANARSSTPWLAVTLLTLAVVAWFAFQTVQLVRERWSLHALKASQDVTVVQAEKVRTQADSIARQTFELAKQGNAGAALIVEQLARRGVTINPSAPPTPLPPK
jgi:uncharacterized lipoprotein YajG